MQTLKILPRLLPGVHAALKCHTIRWKEREIIPGPMLYVNMLDDSDRVMVWVTAVKSMMLSEVAACLGKYAEWPDSALLAVMREHYPGIRLRGGGDLSPCTG